MIDCNKKTPVIHISALEYFFQPYSVLHMENGFFYFTLGYPTIYAKSIKCFLFLNSNGKK